MMKIRLTLLAFAALLYLGFPTGASAYVGAGTGLTAIGAVIAFVASVVLAFVGFIWYPIKRLLRARSKKGGSAR